MSETALKAKQAGARRRRLDSAVAGGVFLSRFDLTQRWGCNMRTAITRIKESKIPEFVFSGQSVRYKVADVEAYENQALAAGFLKRAEQLKRAEEASYASKPKGELSETLRDV